MGKNFEIQDCVKIMGSSQKHVTKTIITHHFNEKKNGHFRKLHSRLLGELSVRKTY